MEKGLYKYYKELPNWTKGVIVVSVIAGVGIISYGLYRKFHKSQREKDAEESLKDTNKDIKNISKYEKPNYLPSQYGAFSDALYEAMSGMGTDEDMIFNVFSKMRNTIDVLSLIQSFGIRDYTDDKILDSNIKPMNLNQWISAELSDSEKEELNTILSSKKIKFQF